MTATARGMTLWLVDGILIVAIHAFALRLLSSHLVLSASTIGAIAIVLVVRHLIRVVLLHRHRDV